MAHYIDLFTPRTWKEFHDAGGTITGFRETHWARTAKIRAGDLFLCYVVGIKRWVSVLEVVQERYRDESKIWEEDIFPVRFNVRSSASLDLEHGVPMPDLMGKLSFFADEDSNWSGKVRCSCTRISDEDGEIIAKAIRDAATEPVARPVNPKLLERSANLYKLRRTTEEGEFETVVTVPTQEDEQVEAAEQSPPVSSTAHTEIQYRLLEVGSRMGLKVWAPRSDRNRQWNGKPLSSVRGLLDDLPTQFDEVTNQTIENIDVLWLQGNAIVAAFEAEHSTSIYSGLLRMSDLLTMQPNINIELFLVAPDEKFGKFKREVPRPTFASRHKPLHKVCGFVPYSKLCEMLDTLRDYLDSLKPEFLKKVAIYYDPAEEYVS